MMSKKLAEFIATIGYAGYFPIASGTLGSILGMILYYFVKDNCISYLIAASLLFALGFIASDVHEKHTGKKDPHEVIIDEAAGIFIVYLFIPFSVTLFIAGFFIYRIFDVLKPFPIRRLERLPGGIGIMADDILAAIYANICLHIIRYFTA